MDTTHNTAEPRWVHHRQQHLCGEQYTEAVAEALCDSVELAPAEAGERIDGWTHRVLCRRWFAGSVGQRRLIGLLSLTARQGASDLDAWQNLNLNPIFGTLADDLEPADLAYISRCIGEAVLDRCEAVA